MYSTLWITFFVALVLSFLTTPLAIKIAPKIGAMDVPKDSRRMHTKAMPRFGGMAIVAGSMISMMFFLSFDERIPVILLGGILIYSLGIADDLFNLSAKIKFVGQFAVAITMYAMNIRITFITNFFGEGNSQLGDAVCFFITVIWIVGITNTVNLIDGLDGLAAGIASISSICIIITVFIFVFPEFFPIGTIPNTIPRTLIFIPSCVDVKYTERIPFQKRMALVINATTALTTHNSHLSGIKINAIMA